MSRIKPLKKELINFSQTHLNDQNHFICIYGSLVSGNLHKNSDIDMFIAVEKKSDNLFNSSFNLLREMSKKYSFKMDSEVPFENKLVVSYEDIDHAINLNAFRVNAKHYYVPPVMKSEEFLRSPGIRWRLLLNAFTSPHEYVSGNEIQYINAKSRAEQALMTLAHSLTRRTDPTPEEILNVLLVGSDGSEGEMYLGYKKERRDVIDRIVEIIKRNLGKTTIKYDHHRSFKK